MISFLRKVSKITSKIEKLLYYLFFIVMMLSIFLQITSRMARVPLSFTEELSRFSYIWIVFVGFAYTKRNNINIRVEFFVELLPKKIQKGIRYFLELLELGIFIFVLYWGIELVKFNKVMLSTAMEISMLFVYIAVPISFTFAVFNSICRIIDISGISTMKIIIKEGD